MLGLLGWYYMGVPGCIQEDSLPKEPMLLRQVTSTAANYSLDFMTTPQRLNPLRRDVITENTCTKWRKKYASSMERRIQMG